MPHGPSARLQDASGAPRSQQRVPQTPPTPAPPLRQHRRCPSTASPSSARRARPAPGSAHTGLRLLGCGPRGSDRPFPEEPPSEAGEAGPARAPPRSRSGNQPRSGGSPRAAVRRGLRGEGPALRPSPGPGGRTMGAHSTETGGTGGSAAAPPPSGGTSRPGLGSDVPLCPGRAGAAPDPPQPWRFRYRERRGRRSGHGGRGPQVAAGTAGGTNRWAGVAPCAPPPRYPGGVDWGGAGLGWVPRTLPLVGTARAGGAGPDPGAVPRFFSRFLPLSPVFSPCSGAAAPPLPNLTPRHRQLIPTPCGPVSTPRIHTSGAAAPGAPWVFLK